MHIMTRSGFLKGEKQADGQEIYYDAINSGISFDDSKDKEYTLKVSLRNSKMH